MATKASVVVDDSDDDGLSGAALEARTYEQFPEIRDIDPEAVAERMASRVRSAESLDELFDSLTGQASDAMVGKSFEFRDVAWQPYRSQRGIIPLAVCDAVQLDTGEVHEFVTTAKMLVTFLRRAQQLGVYPFKARIVEKVTTSGQKALNFERV